jgi:hypothetical protein
MDMGEDVGTTWLPIVEAAPRLGVTVDGLRSRVRRGLVTPRKGNDGRLLVPVSMNGAATGHDQSVDTVSGHEDALDELRAENTDLRVTIARIEERSAAGERREGELVAALAKVEARADALAAELAEARKPALLRLIEALRRR